MKHGDRTKSNTAPEYAAWSSMISRCTDSNVPHWADYGGRGIRVCERWLLYECFLRDVGRKPTPEHTLDRIDNNGHYEPENVRWSTWKQQARNKRNNRIIIINGQSRSVAEWCELLGLSVGTVHARLSRGWSDEAALRPPMKQKGFGQWQDVSR